MRLTLVAITLLSGGCKVPLVNVGAAFGLSEATWFEGEQTLFVFYRVSAEQGLSAEGSVIEVRYATDSEQLPWTRVDALAAVHEHVPVDCGPTALCGSASVHVALPPRNVGVRLRYHKDGAIALVAPTRVNIVGAGPAHTNRSFLVYGVFDENNERVQWRGRHQFPTLRNEEVQALGLRRRFHIDDQRHGTLDALTLDNPYGYGLLETCPADFAPTNVTGEVTTNARAAWNDTVLFSEAAASSAVCARSTVYDARGAFQAVAVARKNPQVAPAFPLLRSPVTENTSLPFLLMPCERTISARHLAMQKQRIMLGANPVICADDWQDASFVSDVAALLRQHIDEERARGRDMVLTLALHHDDESGAFARTIEDLLADLLAPELTKSSPRVSGAFVFDSFAHRLTRADLRSSVLWCPAFFAQSFDDDDFSIPDAAERSCPLLPDSIFSLGPVSFSSLPILASRARYLRFVERYSEAQAGEVRALSFRSPERTPLSHDVPVPPFGVATFFNNETITAAPSDAFSYCGEGNAPPNVVVRSASFPAPVLLAQLPDLHTAAPEPNYNLGIIWDFPFLMRLTYESVLAIGVSAFSLTVPFGVAASVDQYMGTGLWTRDSFDLSRVLLQCTRFCDHPTFDSAGVYNVLAPFRTTYSTMCYRPRFPALVDGGFPRDP